jgi:hypothetical protein
MLRGICGSKKQEVTGGWRKLNNEEIRNMPFLPDFSSMIKSMRLRRIEHIARMVLLKNPYRIFYNIVFCVQSVRELGIFRRILQPLSSG